MRIYNSYQEAVEAQIDEDFEEYYNDEEENEDEEMDEADRLYDEMQDKKAIEHKEKENGNKN